MSGAGRAIARKLGLPIAHRLDRRADRPEPLLAPVRVFGNTPGAQRIGEVVASWAPRSGGELERRGDGNGGQVEEGLGTAVLVLDELTHPRDLEVTELARAVRRMKACGRVIVIARAPEHPDPIIAAVRGGIAGMVRSMAKESRSGITVNGIYLSDDLHIADPALLAALRFLASAGSAFVTGQLLTIDQPGHLPSSWDRPHAGRCALLTGAGGGIGTAIAQTLAAGGAELVLVDLPGSRDLAGLAGRLGGHALPGDITEPDVIVRELSRRGLEPQIIIHNAGITRDRSFVNLSERDWRKTIAVNLTAQLDLTRALWRPDLHLVSLSSTSGIAGNVGQANYAYTKSAILSMIRAQAAALAPGGGTANAVAPGFIDTAMTRA
ncbi:MAG: SDR family oxidoreductase, partial [Flaviflexus sp.]|nr:SDR family oxidoreductase [Flaviflexus sp.]